MNKEELKKRIAELDLNIQQMQLNFQQFQSNYSSLVGAKQECEFWMKKIEEKEKEKEVEPLSLPDAA